jgi:DNA-binding response OmpR family regulator
MSGMRVLVIDDEPDVLMLCRVNLRYAGHEVLEAPDADQGFRLATSAAPDVILLDVMLPERDGLSMLRDLAQHPATAATPVVLLTAKAQVEDQLRGWRAGCSEYVTKPFLPADLGVVVESVHAMSTDEREIHRRKAIEDLGAS